MGLKVRVTDVVADICQPDIGDVFSDSEILLSIWEQTKNIPSNSNLGHIEISSRHFDRIKNLIEERVPNFLDVEKIPVESDQLVRIVYKEKTVRCSEEYHQFITFLKAIGQEEFPTLEEFRVIWFSCLYSRFKSFNC